MVGLNPVSNLSYQMMNELGAAIVQGELSNENGIPTEKELSERFNTSRVSTREAVKMLSAKGLLTSRPRRGIRIEPKNHWDMFDADVLGWLLKGASSPAQLKELLQLRMAIEPEAAALAASARNERDVQLVETALGHIKDAENGLKDALDAEIAFHSSLLVASGNPFFMQLISAVETALRLSARYRITGTTGFNDYRIVYEAISKQQSELARSATKVLQMEAMSRLQQLLKSEGCNDE